MATETKEMIHPRNCKFLFEDRFSTTLEMTNNSDPYIHRYRYYRWGNKIVRTYVRLPIMFQPMEYWITMKLENFVDSGWVEVCSYSGSYEFRFTESMTMIPSYTAHENAIDKLMSEELIIRAIQILDG